MGWLRCTEREKLADLIELEALLWKMGFDRELLRDGRLHEQFPIKSHLPPELGGHSGDLLEYHQMLVIVILKTLVV